MLVLMLAIGAIGATISAYRCHARWAGSGMQTEWALLSGCQLETQPGTWIPEDRYRQIP